MTLLCFCSTVRAESSLPLIVSVQDNNSAAVMELVVL